MSQATWLVSVPGTRVALDRPSSEPHTMITLGFQSKTAVARSVYPSPSKSRATTSVPKNASSRFSPGIPGSSCVRYWQRPTRVPSPVP